MHLSTVKGAGVVVRQGTDARTLRNTASVYDLASAAIEAGHSLAAEVAAADLVIALDETEHPPFMRQRFAAWADRIGYWDVPDAHLLNTEDALARIAERVDALQQQLGAGSHAYESGPMAAGTNCCSHQPLVVSCPCGAGASAG